MLEGIPRRRRRRLALRTAARTGATVACLGVAYYVVPLDRGFSVVTGSVLAGALVVLAWIIGWHARAIMRSEHPRLRAVEALTSSLALFLVVFSLSYCLMSSGAEMSFSEPLTRTDALYFTLTCFSSVGFGDITPRSEGARVLTMVQMLGNLVFLGLVAKILLEAVHRGLDRRARSE
ncbi:potassium channel family protein [Spirillospora sp. NPDC047279]|uniref:potassium channel family protein n=1 Tax=Spirillospora sp. NPDC047279 TaxID=3155478 RepID=UPI0033F47613